MRRAGYLVVGFAIDLMLGTAYAWSVVARPLREGFGASEFEAMLPNAVALAGFAVGMVPGGRLVDRHGPRKVAVLGGLLFGGGYLLASLMALTPWPLAWLALTYGVVVGLGIGIAYSATLATAVRWYPDRKGLASGFVVMGFGLSAIATAPVLSALVAAVGLPGALAALGAVFTAGAAGLALLLAFPPAGFAPPRPATASRRTWTPALNVPARDMLRTRTFWLAWLLYAMGTSAGFMVINKAQPIAEQVGGASGAMALAAVQLLAVFNCLGRPAFGRVSDRFGPRATAELMSVVLLMGLAVLATAGPGAPTYLGIGLVGLVFGGFLAVMPSMASYFFGDANLGQNYGLVFTGYGLGSVVALFSIGPLRDAFGSYVPAFYLAMGFAAAALGLSILLRPPKQAPSPVAPRAPAGA
jgi:OFA family oxalate/formate antiporter-like MFS transporter